MTHKRRAPPPPRGWRQRWTIQRATVAGLGCGLAALLLASAFGSWADAVLYPYAILLALTLVCGLSILWISFWDMRARERGVQVRPIRAFDVVAGIVLTVPSAYALWVLWPQLR
ncbi:MAG: hypothetical protein JO276_00990 [Sphingomonadaceae bacterium]|nr:hypothetical protein [Sphingomonadaceae bacterium]